MTAFVGWIAAATVAGQLATAGVWGRHRDEFYYLACGRHLDWGYVDHPPLTPLLYRLADVTVGTSQIALRIAPALIHGATVVLVALVARSLGGSARAQALAAVAAALAPLALTTGHFLGTVTFEIAAGSALAILLVRIADGGDPRLWLAVGAVAGVGLLNKWTLGFALGGLAVGMLIGNREVLATPWLGAGALLTAVIVAPNVLWQAQHGWPQVEFARTLRDYGQAPALAPAQIAMLGSAAVLAIPGTLWLLRESPRHRFLVLGFAVALVAVLATGGKPYYTAALVLPLAAAGAVALQDAGPRTLPVVLGLGILLAPFATPLTPRSTTDVLRRVNPELGEMVGWEDLAATVSRLHREHPGAGIVTGNYSEAGAVGLLGNATPPPASGHNSYWGWGPPVGAPDAVLAVGIDRTTLARAFDHVTRIATIHTPGGIHNLENGAPVWLASGRRGPWSELWPAFRRV